MKQQILLLLAVLLTGVSAIALASLNGLNAVITVTFQVDPEGAGDVLLSGQKKTSTMAFSNHEMTISATSNPGYSFEGWYIDGEKKGSNASSFTFMTAESDMTVVAKFNVLAASSLTLKVKEGKGSVSFVTEGTVVSEGSRKYTTGSEVTVLATPVRGNEFVRWEDSNGNVLATTRRYTFTIQNDITLQAVFQAKENYKDDLVAFPGAEGYGRFTTGGRAFDDRGSKVYYVTRLDDSDEEGTFRWAVNTGDDTPRTVLFKVAGTIYLTRNVDVKSNTTIAGQTAPAGGICLAGYRVKLGSNIIIRHIRFRAGDLPNKSMSPLGVENVENVVLDHCSFGWSMEENLTLYDNNNTTTQWCIFAEGLYNSRNDKGARAYGAQWGGKRSTMHHCLFANNNSRSPRFNGVRPENHDRQAINEFTNNVIYNWGSPNAIYGGENSAGGDTDYNRVYMINNYYRPGPATKDATSSRRYWCSASGEMSGVGQWYLNGNKFELGSKWAPSSNIWSDTELQKVNSNNYYGFVANDASRAMNFWSLSPSQALADRALLTEPVVGELSYTTYESADAAYQKVVTQAGASLPRYDEVDARVLAEAAGTRDPQFGGDRGNKLGIIDSPYDITLQQHDEFVALYEGDNAEDNAEIDVTCYPRLQGDSYDEQVIDTDGDGLPDDYETANGLNPNDGSDGQRLTASGYSNLEIFLNGVADRTIDMTEYTVHQPAAMANRFNAIVAQDGSGNYTTVQDAVNAAPGNTPYYIFIKAGTYEGHVQIDKANVHLTGQSPESTVITWNKTNADGGGVDKSATINVTASDVSFDNLTIRNTRVNEGQALALYTKADRISITSCCLEGWQDTYRTGKDGQRHVVRNSTFTGTTDFIYGAGEVFFDGCTLHVLRPSNVIVAPDHSSAKYGYVFRDARITAAAANTKTHLGRPWGNTPKVAFINTSLSSDVAIPAEGWQEMDGKPVRMAEYNTMDANGNAVDLSGRRTSFGGTPSKAVLSKTEAVNDNRLDYMLRGTDGWDADWQAFILPAPQLTVSGNTASWTDPTGFAQCFMVTLDGKATVTTANSISTGGAQYVTVQSVSAYGVLSELASSGTPSGVSQLTTGVEVVGRQYFTPDGRRVNRLQHGLNIVRATMADGTTQTTKVVAK